MGFVPYVKPGFELAKRAAAVYEQNPTVEGLILDKHGIITFGDDARESYERMIDAVTLVEKRINDARETPFAAIDLPATMATATEIAPIIRGAVSIVLDDGEIRRQVSEFRNSPEIESFINGSQLKDYGRRGVSTPDLAIRIKNQPLLLPPPSKDNLENYAEHVRGEVEDYITAYRGYFERCDVADDIERTMLDPMPRLVLVPGVGMFGFGTQYFEQRGVGEAGVAASRFEGSSGRRIVAVRVQKHRGASRRSPCCASYLPTRNVREADGLDGFVPDSLKCLVGLWLSSPRVWKQRLA